MGLFKTSGTFAKYVHAQLGNDFTGDGTRNNPYATITKAISTGGGSTLFSGYISESLLNIRPLGTITGDTQESHIGNDISIWDGGISNCKINNLLNYSPYGISAIGSNLIVLGVMQVMGNSSATSKNNFINEFRHINNTSNLSLNYINNSTVLIYKNYVSCLYSFEQAILKNGIFVSSVDLYNYTSRSTPSNYPVFQNCLFRKATVWKWSGTPITINWNGAGATLMEKVYNSLVTYANTIVNTTDKAYALAILATQATMFQDCVVYDDSDSANPIFSKYLGGVPVDYTLALKSNNPALYMSTVGSYVGCYAANVNDDGAGNALTFGAVKRVNTATGVDYEPPYNESNPAPDLLIQDGSNLSKFSASQSSTQFWNRIRTSVVAYPRGKSFAGMQSQLDSGIASRLFFGKRQEIRTNGDVAQKTTAFESVEVIPYDSIPANNNTTQNTINNMSALLPRFSAPFNGECLMFYKGGVPLTFGSNNELRALFTGAGTVAITTGSATVTGTGTAFLADFIKDDNIRINGVDYKVLSVASNTSLTLTTNSGVTLSGQSYSVGVQVDKSQTIYGAWAVTNADIESYSLLQKATKAGLTTSIPLIKYAKFELNLHYDEE